MKKNNAIFRIKKDFFKNKWIYLMLAPVIVYYAIFSYAPMYGAIIAFKNFSIGKGILASEWVGFYHFKNFFNSYYFFRILRNSILINIYDIVFHFPAPIILALLLNEIRQEKFKKAVQTITYLPHFISMVVICGIIVNFLTRDGIINDIIEFFGGERILFLLRPEYFRTIYIGSAIWQQVGWGSIIYMAALTSIDMQLYEAATIDGAGRFRQLWHITLPGIAPTIIIMLILRFGNIVNVGSEKILLLYNPSIYETADVISTFVYRKGILEANYSYSTAVGLFNSTINFIFIITVNKISKMLQETSLW